MKIEIRDTKTDNKSGVAKATGKPYSINEQRGYVHLDGQPYPKEIKFSIKDGSTAYVPGFYSLSDASFFVNKFGGLTVGTLSLTRIGDLPQSR